jgi:flagellar basal-body rod protein FlgF
MGAPDFASQGNCIVNSGIYTAYSGLKAQVDALDLLANNLANLNTPGFKEEMAFFTVLNAAGEIPQAELNSTVNRSVMTRGTVNPTEGSLNPTNRDLDIAIEGQGFLVVQTPHGIRYTRNGSLKLDGHGVLTTMEGAPVLGTEGRPITLGPGKISIGEDGTVAWNEALAGRLKVITFDDFTKLEKEGSSLLVSRAGREQEKNADAKIKSGYLEQANVNAVSSVVRMVEIMRRFEAIQKSIVVMNDINSKSIEKLGR